MGLRGSPASPGPGPRPEAGGGLPPVPDDLPRRISASSSAAPSPLFFLAGNVFFSASRCFGPLSVNGRSGESRMIDRRRLATGRCESTNHDSHSERRVRRCQKKCSCRSSCLSPVRDAALRPRLTFPDQGSADHHSLGGRRGNGSHLPRPGRAIGQVPGQGGGHREQARRGWRRRVHGRRKGQTGRLYPESAVITPLTILPHQVKTAFTYKNFDADHQRGRRSLHVPGPGGRPVEDA